MLYVTSLALIYFLTVSLYLLTAFIQFTLHPHTPNSGKHKSDLFCYDFVTFWSIIDLQHYVSYYCTTQWFYISIHIKMFTMIGLVTICHHKNILHSYWLYSPHCTFHTHDSFILQLEVCTFWHLHPIPLVTTNLISFSMTLLLFEV